MRLADGKETFRVPAIMLSHRSSACGRKMRWMESAAEVPTWQCLDRKLNASHMTELYVCSWPYKPKYGCTIRLATTSFMLVRTLLQHDYTATRYSHFSSMRSGWLNHPIVGKVTNLGSTSRPKHRPWLSITALPTPHLSISHHVLEEVEARWVNSTEEILQVVHNASLMECGWLAFSVLVFI